MNKKILPLIILGLIIIILFIFYLIKSPRISWNTKNSLIKTNIEIIKDDGNRDLLLTSVKNSISYMERIPDERIFSFGKEEYSKIQMLESLQDFKSSLIKFGLSENFYSYIIKNFDFYSSATKKVLFTGYYEALLNGSKEKSGEYIYPIYKKPDDLVTVELKEFPIYKKVKGLPTRITGRINEENRIIPYYTRDEIDNLNILSGNNLELLWVKDPISLFFLHIQGSGIIKLENGEEIRINYAGSNGHPYRAIGKFLVEKGICEYNDLSMQFIATYIKENLDEAEEIFNFNPSYVFFRIVDEGPIGSLGVPVTPFRTIATDRNIFPHGSLCYIKTKLPMFNNNGEITGYKPFIRFVLNQDTGGAIRSPSRADIFTGNGKKSERIAGHLKSYGKLFFLIKKRGLK